MNSFQQDLRRRSLLQATAAEGQQQAGAPTPPPRHEHHTSAEWGPLAVQEQYLVSLPANCPPELQQAYLQQLHSLGASLTSFLPPATWLVLAPQAAVPFIATWQGVQLVRACGVPQP